VSVAHEHAGHAHPHGHRHHTHGDRARSRRALAISLVLNGVFLVVEAAIGWWSGSLALLSDAAHMLSDVAALTLALFAAHLALRPATPARTFGFLRAEILGAFINAVLLVVACVFIFREALGRLAAGAPEVPGVPILAVAALGLMINLGSAYFLWKSDSENLNVRGALVHMLADALGSGGALVAALLIIGFGWNAADAVVSMLIAILVLYGAWGILRDSTWILLEFAPRGLGQDVVSGALADIDGVEEVHELHVWSAGGGEATITAHLIPREGADHQLVLRRAESLLRRRFGVRHTTIQVEAAADPCRQRDCPMLLPDEPERG